MLSRNVIIFIFILTIALTFIFEYVYISENEKQYNNIMDKCGKYYTYSTTKNKYDSIKVGYKLWKYLLNQKDEGICSFFISLFIFKINKTYYYHRIYNSKKYILNKGIFPDNSYYRLVPFNKNNYENVVTHTYEIQNYLYKYQHPNNCKSRNFIIIRGYGSGHGSEIHVMTSYLALALSLNRIAIIDPFTVSTKAKGKYCKKYNNWLCFIEQLTNCSIFSEEYKNAIKFNNINQTDKYIYIGGTLRARKIIPQQIINILKNSAVGKNKLLHYWKVTWGKTI